MNAHTFHLACMAHGAVGRIKSTAARAPCWLALFAIVVVSPSMVRAADPVGRQWPKSQRVAYDRIDHSPYGALLQRYVDEDGYVDYAAWQRSKSDRRELQNYLASLGRADENIRYTKEAKIAFWINAYNALTLEGILREYPTDSIRDHTAAVFGYNIWQDLPLHVGDGKYALELIEHKVLRKMDEPRIHFAIVCASIGCPRLRSEAYTADRLEEQLTDNAKDFFSRRQNFRFDAQRRAMSVSRILEWFPEDFGNTQQERFANLRTYLPEAAHGIAVSPQTRVTYLDYNWSLNDQARKAKR